MPLELNQPVTKITNPALGAEAVDWSLEMPANIMLGALLVQLSVTVSATGAATKSVPTLSTGCSLVTMLINGTPNKTRALTEIFGVSGGINATNDPNAAGTVQYFQGGNAVTAAVAGITYGAKPVPIGSEADIAIKAALANDTATTAVFGLPFMLAEDFRKSYRASVAMALPTAFGKNGRATGNLGGVVFQFKMKPVTGAAGTFSAATIAANVEYDNSLAAEGTQIRLLKEKRFFKEYAVGDIELADQIKNVNGESLQYVGLLTAADKITKVVVKQGNAVLRTLTWEDNLLSLRKAGINVDAIPRNLFLIAWDRNDDPTTGLEMDAANELSIVATFATAADAPKTVTILTGIYGAVE